MLAKIGQPENYYCCGHLFSLSLGQAKLGVASDVGVFAAVDTDSTCSLYTVMFFDHGVFRLDVLAGDGAAVGRSCARLEVSCFL